MSNQKGKLIVIDGIDGSGKATQTKILVEKLTNHGLQVETMDFPQYQNFFGQMVRRYLDGEFGNATEVNPYLASILYAGDRFESARQIQTWLDQGKIVILDRYYTSNLIHQGTKFSESEIDQYIFWNEKMEFEIFKIPKPDLVIYLHLPSEIAYNLISKRGDGHDGHDTLEHMKTAENRCQYFAKKLNWQTIECTDNNNIKTKQEIADNIFKKVKSNIDF